MRTAEIRDKPCVDCGDIILRKSTRCYSCSGRINVPRIPWNKGRKGVQVSWIKGKTHSLSTRRKLSLNAIGRSNTAESESKRLKSLAKHYDAVGRKTYRTRVSKEGKEWRDAIFKRDNYTCRQCGQVRGKIEAHHIKKFADFSEHRYDLDNGITLCTACHKLTPNYGRKRQHKLPQDDSR